MSETYMDSRYYHFKLEDGVLSDLTDYKYHEWCDEDEIYGGKDE